MKNDSAITIKFTEKQPTDSQPQQTSLIRFEQLWGTLRLVSAVPAWTPKGRLEDSLALYINSTTYRLYVYDYSNAAWRYASLT
jgi:hypothetical protein